MSFHEWIPRSAVPAEAIPTPGKLYLDNYDLRVGDFDLGNGRSLPLFLDPDSFDPAVAGVVMTYDDLNSLSSNMKNTGIDYSDLGDSTVVSACTDFHRAWVAETELTAKAVGIIVELLPRVKRAYQEVDQDSGGSIDSSIAEMPAQVPPIAGPSDLSPRP